MGFHRIWLDRDQQQYSDQALVIQALENKGAYASLVRRYEGPLLRYISRVMRDDFGAAQKLLMEVFIKTYIYLNEYDDSIPFSSWIYRIAHDEIADYLPRSKNDLGVLKKGDDSDSFTAIADELGLKGQDGQMLTTLDEVRAAVDQLEVSLRDVIVLKFFEEKTDEEMADILRLPLRSIISLLSEATEKLKIYLKKG